MRHKESALFCTGAMNLVVWDSDGKNTFRLFLSPNIRSVVQRVDVDNDNDVYVPRVRGGTRWNVGQAYHYLPSSLFTQEETTPSFSAAPPLPE